MVTVRHAFSDDAPAIAGVRERSIRRVIGVLDPPLYTPDEIAAWAANYSSRRVVELIAQANFLVAEEGGRVVGHGRLVLEPPGAGVVRGLFVDAGCVGRGIGGAVLTRLLKLGAEAGVARFELVATLNARSFYQRHGFVCLERVSHTVPNGAVIPGLRMRRGG